MAQEVMRLDYYEIIFGSFFLTAYLFNYLRDPSFYSISLIFAGLTFIVMGVFEFRKYYNKHVFIAVIAVILLVMWLFNFIQPLSPDADIIVYFPAGVSTLIILALAIWTLKRWMKNEKVLKEYDEALKVNPDYITVLNNKGVVLTIQRDYDDAFECFDKVLEIAQEDAVTLQNKNMLKMKLQHKTLSDQISDYPQLEIVEGEGRSILEIKKK